MTCSVFHQKIKTVLEKSSAVYSVVVGQDSNPNMDHAGYACHASLNRLLSTLSPQISSETASFENLLRRVARKHTAPQKDTQKSWSSMMNRLSDGCANAN